MLLTSMLGVTGFCILKAKKLGFVRGYLYSNDFHLMLFMSDTYSYVPIQISDVSGDISIFKLTGALKTQLSNAQKVLYLRCTRYSLVPDKDTSN